MKIKVKRFHPDAKIPEYKSKGAAGCDVYSLEEVTIKAGDSAMVRTGVGFEFPEGYFLLMAPRGSFALKNHLDMPNSVAIGDADFRGEYIMPLRSIGNEDVVVEKHERIGQILFIPVEQAEFIEVDELEETERGEGKFGSTGKF